MDKEYLVKKWLTNDLTNEEAEAFSALEDAALYKEIIEESKRFSGNTNAKVESFAALDKKLDSKSGKSINWAKAVSAIAAIFVVGFALFTLVNRDNINTFNTELAQNEVIVLPDNSTVNLNELSELKYNTSKWQETRSLDLKGEAFFDVEKGKRFDVRTEFGTVSVLGTEFNVFSRDSVFKVACYEGLVQVSYNNNSIKLPAGTAFMLSSGKGVKSDIAITEPHWLKNMSVFDNASFDAVVKELEKQYNIKIQYPANLSLRFTGAFEHDNLENALKSISKPLNLTYIIEPNNMVIIENGEN
ncbi:FecR family protein [Winogradskyella wandonensis]|uniref:FecR family protein n=1 Tax=Winogradskyella wandonensis TaxID=1442586 RepID=A0A4R1KTR3_9FLAO|nr:FecR family protein [Winogradskyella wandonensis]TCK67927.1 FecR family protein [Winogradskyella wandonensis]